MSNANKNNKNGKNQNVPVTPGITGKKRPGRKTGVASAPDANRRINYQITPTSPALTQQQAFALYTPEQRAGLEDGTMVVCPKGGGTIRIGAFVSEGAFVGVCASVPNENAWVGKRVTLQDSAVAEGHVIGNTTISGKARIGEGCSVENQARIGDEAALVNGAKVTGRVTVGGKMALGEGVRLGGEFRLVGSFVLVDAHFSIGDNLVIDKSSQIRDINNAFRKQTG